MGKKTYAQAMAEQYPVIDELELIWALDQEEQDKQELNG